MLNLNAWISTYGRNKTKKLFCKWYVDTYKQYVDLGEKALREHIIGRDEQVRTYHFHQNWLTITIIVQQNNFS